MILLKISRKVFITVNKVILRRRSTDLISGFLLIVCLIFVCWYLLTRFMLSYFIIQNNTFLIPINIIPNSINVNEESYDKNQQKNLLNTTLHKPSEKLGYKETTNLKSSKLIYDLQKLSLKEYSPSLDIPIALVFCESVSLDLNLDFQSDSIIKRFGWERQKEQIRTMLGSILLFSKSKNLRFLIISNSKNLFYRIKLLVLEWPEHQRNRLDFEFHRLVIQSKVSNIMQQWRPCAWAKMFLPETLPKTLDSIVYFDTDFLFLGPIENIWSIWEKMNTNHLFSVSSEPLYLVETSRPKAGKSGINTGVMLMNLTRLRSFSDNGFGISLVNEYENNKGLPFSHDQDALNSYMSNRTDQFLELSSQWNFSPTGCMEKSPLCPNCLSDGIIGLHGSDASFYREDSSPKIRVCIN